MKSIHNLSVLSTQKMITKISKKKLKKVPLVKNEISGKKNRAGRNHTGKITVRHQGGGHKKRYRKINFSRNKDSIGIITSIEYDPYRTAFIASVYDFLNFCYFYTISPKDLKIGDIIKSGSNAEPKLGHSLSLIKIPVGSFIHNISLRENSKAQLTRAGGTRSQLIEKTSKFCKIKLNSGEFKLLSPTCQATIGTVSNENTVFCANGKAGRSRWLNKRPTVRGVAMNPIDHPHGGGEGKSSGTRSSVTPWGKPTKNGSTSRSKKKLLIVK